MIILFLIDYRPYLEKAAKTGIVKSRRTSIGIIGASGAGKMSVMRLLLNQPPVLHHDSTPVARPLKGIWLVSDLGNHQKWMEGSLNTLHTAVANSIQQEITNKDESKTNFHNEENVTDPHKNTNSHATSSLSDTSSSPPTSPLPSAAKHDESILNLPATLGSC